MWHSETWKKRFDAIGKKKLDKLMEEATRNAEPPLVSIAEMEMEQPQELPMTGGASSSSGLAPSGREAVPLPSPSSHDVRMEIPGRVSDHRTFGGNWSKFIGGRGNAWLACMTPCKRPLLDHLVASLDHWTNTFCSPCAADLPSPPALALGTTVSHNAPVSKSEGNILIQTSKKAATSN